MAKSLNEIKRINKNIKDNALLVQAVRPLGPYLAWGALRLKLTPNFVSYINFFLSLVICLLLAFGTPSFQITAGILLLLWQTLDCTDGTMARALQKCSKYGGFVDYAGGMFLLAFFQISIGVGLFLHPENSVHALLSWLDVNIQYLPGYSLIICASSSIMALLVRLINKDIETSFGKNLVINNDGVPDKSRGTIRNIIKNVENLGGLQIPFFWLAVLFNHLELFVIFYFFINMGILVAFTVRASMVLRHTNEHS